ncbi:MAG: helix-turn-helix domain-containing protein [Eubacterium sp.]|nr:helix-turn-helix domain-containing protein [Eubacterium sp.]
MNNTDNTEKYARLLKVSEVAKILFVTEVTVRKLIKNNRIKAVKIGNSYRISNKNLNDFLDSGSKN